MTSMSLSDDICTPMSNNRYMNLFIITIITSVKSVICSAAVKYI